MTRPPGRVGESSSWLALPDGWQWTSSLYRRYPYRAGDGRKDPNSAETRVTRGGAHDWPAQGITATHRGGGLSRAPAAGHHNIGFRCAR